MLGKHNICRGEGQQWVQIFEVYIFWHKTVPFSAVSLDLIPSVFAVGLQVIVTFRSAGTSPLPRMAEILPQFSDSLF